MNSSQWFEHYMEHLVGGLGHMDRHAGLKDYCTGLILPLSRKRGADGGTGGSAARERPTSVAAPLCGQGLR